MELVVRNRRLIESDLRTIGSLIQTEGFLGRSHLSRRLCRLWQWRQSNGAYREIACRDLLRQVERRGLIELPPALHAARRAGYQNQVQAPSVVMDSIEVSLDRVKVAHLASFQRHHQTLQSHRTWGSGMPLPQLPGASHGPTACRHCPFAAQLN